MNIEELDAYNLDDAVKFHDSLNPRLWDSSENLLPEVREKLLAISADFEEFLGLDAMSVQDITLSGSNAAYNYTDHSDIDLHLVVNMPQGDLAKVYRELFDAKKYQYNDQHNITIGGFDVELYVQDSDQPHHSQGIYSVKNNKWLSVPRRRKADIDDSAVQSKYQDLGARIENMIGSSDLTQLDRMWHKIKTMRQTGLAREGEFGVDNVAFKLLRATGLIEKLAAARTAARDAELSLTERRRKKKKNRVRYGYGGYWTPGFNFGGDSGDSGDGGGGGGESMQEASTPDGVSATTKMFLEQNTANTADIVKDFVSFCVKEIGINQQPRLRLRRDPAWSQRNHSFGQFDPATNELNVSVANRHVMDILRTVAHELVHHSQQEQQDLPPSAGETGSEYENEANARAGELMREYGQQHPELFEPGAVAEGWREKLGGAVLAAACVAGTPGCATTGQLAQGAQIAARTAKTMQGRDIKGIARAELEQEIRNLARAQRGDANAQNLSRIHQLQKRQQQQNESSGYIPTRSERNNPKFKMALSPDVQPGAIGLNANRLGLKTGPQGEPTLLIKELQNALREFKETDVLPLVEEQENLFEISMSPSSLKKLSAQTGALAGMEFEMIVPNTDGGDDSGDLEPDYEYDERCRSIEDAVQFFHDGDYNGRRDVERLRDRMLNDFHEWLGDKLYREWERNGEEYLEEWVPNNVDESEWNPDGLEGEARAEALAEFIANLHADPGGSNAFDEYREENLESYDESDWLDDEDLDRMSSIENTYSMSWPHWTSTGSGESSIEDVANEFQDAIGRDVKASSSYHSGRVERPSTKSLHYIVEPDGSLDPNDNNDQGLEFVSPPLPIEELLSDLNKVKAWADRTGCYTNDSTGLHINVSVPGWDGDMNKLDYVKLAVLLGDEYVLDSFGRAGNTYAKSAMGKIRSIVKQNPAKAEELLQRMKSGMDQLASKAIHSGVTEKYTSINTKTGYIEFRSPGGDWLNNNFAEIENTLRRFTVALSAAVDPEMYRKEYLKKLYKLLDVSGEKDPLSYFAKYSAGELPRAALKSFVRQAQAERKVKSGKADAEEYDKLSAIHQELGLEPPQRAAQQPQGVDTRVNYELYDRTTNAVIDTFPARNDDEARVRLDDYRSWPGASNPDNFGVRRAGRPATTAPAPTTEQYYDVTWTDGGSESHMRVRAVTATAATYMVRSHLQRQGIGAENIEAQVSRYQDAPGSTTDLQRQRAAAAQQPALQPAGGEFTGNWLIRAEDGTVLHRFGGIGNSQADANRTAQAWAQRNPDVMRQHPGGVDVVPEMNESLRESVNDYLWHGSKSEHDILYPQQANDTGGKKESNKNAVYATPSARVAIAMGLTTPGSDTGMFPNDPQMVLFNGGIRKGQMIYLHKVPKNLFIKHNDREWYSKPGVKEVKPLEVVTVPVDKWLHLIRQATPADLELQKKYTQKQNVKEYKMPQPSQGPGRYKDLNEPLGPEFPPTMPAGTVKVDVSDVYDWYKLGQHISNMKGLGKHDFGQGPPGAIMSFGDEDLEHQYIQALKRTGLTTTDIDPVDPDQPPGMPRQKTDPTYNVDENFADGRNPGRKSLSKRAGVEVRPEIK
jgi:hypothetical protein